MCTVTFIPTEQGFYFTSSRDEKESRVTIPPSIYNSNGIELLFPKDELAGGTWIASNKEGRTACLLNGAFIKHRKAKKYSRSRGLIVLESFNYKTANDFYEQVELRNVEPFTLLTLDYQSGSLDAFYEFRWDGNNKHLKKLSHTENQIWSSVTLYNTDAQTARESLFNNWIKKHQFFVDKMILNFHYRKHGLETSNDIIMKGKGDLMTLSISQIQVVQHQASFNYFDIINKKEYKVKLQKKQ